MGWGVLHRTGWSFEGICRAFSPWMLGKAMVPGVLPLAMIFRAFSPFDDGDPGPEL